MTKTALLLGSYGQSNLGDDLLMWNYLELLEARGFTTIYTNIAEFDLVPDAIKVAYPNLRYLPTYTTPITRYFKLIKEADCIIYGGGTLYKELYASTGRSRYSVIVRMMGFNMLAKLLGTNVYHLNIGIGSLRTSLGRLFSKWAIKSSALTVFRDTQSYDYAKDVLRVHPSRLQKSTDGLFLDSRWQSEWNPAPAIQATKGKRVIGINVLSDIPDWVDRAAYKATIRAFVRERLEQGDHILFIPFQHAFNHNNDALFIRDTFSDILEAYRSSCTLPDQIPLEQVSSYLRRCDLFVGMRLHSLLLATANHVPFLALAYDTKCWRFIQESNYPHALKLEHLTNKNLNEAFTTAFSERASASDLLHQISEQNYNEAGEALRNVSL